MLITIGSITTATRAAKIIEKKTGIRGQVINTPAEINHGGCSYSIRYNDRYETTLKKAVYENGIPVKKWYREASGHYDLS